MQGHQRFDISFVIPVRNDASRLSRCLSSIRANVYPQRHVEIIVVDNGSTDDSAGVAAAAGARVLAGARGRVAQLRNQGAAAASATILAFVDADHVLAPHWIQTAVDGLADDDSIGALGALCLAPADATRVQRAYDRLRGRSSGRGDAQWLGAGNLAVSRDAFNAVGGFDASLETCEDVDLCKKLRAAGRRLVSDERLVNVHLGDPSTLPALFRGELWRGRSNLAVSFRPPVRWNELPSAIIPIVQLAAVVALMFAPWVSANAMAATISVLLVAIGPSVLRAIRMSSRGGGSMRDVADNIRVAVVYDFARAFALVAFASHGVRRRSA